MDFALAYTEEQERFRNEVRGWIKENVPVERRDPVDSRDITPEQDAWGREKHKDMAAKGR